MNKKIFSLSIVLVMILLLAQVAYSAPIPFSDTITFGVLEIDDTYNYTHTLAGLNSTGYDLLDATLSLRHNGNSNNPGEVWFASSGGNILIGQLSASSGTTWTLDSWVLSANILTEIENSTPWSLTVNLYDTTTGTDKIKLDYLTIAGNYEPTNAVPEPSTLVLLGIGFAGIGFLRRRFKN